MITTKLTWKVIRGPWARNQFIWLSLNWLRKIIYIRTYLNSIHQVCYLPHWYWKRIFFLISLIHFLYFWTISPLKTAWPFTWTNLKTLRQVWMKFVQWLLRRKYNWETFTDRITDRQTDGRTDGRTDERRSKKQLSWAKKIQAIFSVISSWWKHKKK